MKNPLPEYIICPKCSVEINKRHFHKHPTIVGIFVARCPECSTKIYVKQDGSYA
jgi:rubredoxin